MPRVAVLDDNGLLIGSKDKSKLAKGEVECGDLPCDGSYRLRDGQFIHKNHGFGKPKDTTTSPYHALYLMICALETGSPLPKECIDWAEWYKEFGGKR